MAGSGGSLFQLVARCRGVQVVNLPAAIGLFLDDRGAESANAHLF